MEPLGAVSATLFCRLDFQVTASSAVEVEGPTRGKDEASSWKDECLAWIFSLSCLKVSMPLKVSAQRACLNALSFLRYLSTLFNRYAS